MYEMWLPANSCFYRERPGMCVYAIMHWVAHIGIISSLLYFSGVRVCVCLSLMCGLTIVIAISIHMTALHGSLSVC